MTMYKNYYLKGKDNLPEPLVEENDFFEDCEDEAIREIIECDSDMEGKYIYSHTLIIYHHGVAEKIELKNKALKQHIAEIADAKEEEEHQRWDLLND